MPGACWVDALSLSLNYTEFLSLGCYWTTLKLHCKLQPVFLSLPFKTVGLNVHRERGCSLCTLWHHEPNSARFREGHPPPPPHGLGLYSCLSVNGKLLLASVHSLSTRLALVGWPDPWDQEMLTGSLQACRCLIPGKHPHPTYSIHLNSVYLNPTHPI